MRSHFSHQWLATNPYIHWVSFTTFKTLFERSYFCHSKMPKKWALLYCSVPDGVCRRKTALLIHWSLLKTLINTSYKADKSIAHFVHLLFEEFSSIGRIRFQEKTTSTKSKAKDPDLIRLTDSFAC